jgi:hypothetical protein
MEAAVKGAAAKVIRELINRIEMVSSDLPSCQHSQLHVLISKTINQLFHQLSAVLNRRSCSHVAKHPVMHPGTSYRRCQARGA